MYDYALDCVECFLLLPISLALGRSMWCRKWHSRAELQLCSPLLQLRKCISISPGNNVAMSEGALWASVQAPGGSGCAVHAMKLALNFIGERAHPLMAKQGATLSRCIEEPRTGGISAQYTSVGE